VPNSKLESKYADGYISSLTEAIKGFNTEADDVATFEKQASELLVKVVDKAVWAGIESYKENECDSISEHVHLLTQPESLKNLHKFNADDAFKELTTKYGVLHFNYSALADLKKERKKADWGDKLRFVLARFLSTIAIGGGALLMTYIGYHYMGFESAVIKRIPQEVTNNPIVISKVISVYDGDTFRVNIEGYPDIIGENIPIRVNVIDTPKIKGQCDYEKQLAIKAKYFTSTFLSGGTVELRNIEREKYFRIAADVYVDGVSLGNSLIDAGLAYKYDKKKKKNWCEK
jgi:micrococcal nuclease